MRRNLCYINMRWQTSLIERKGYIALHGKRKVLYRSTRIDGVVEGLNDEV